MITDIYFVVAGICFWVYAFKHKDNLNREIQFPVVLGIISILVVVFDKLNYEILTVLSSFLGLFLVIVNTNRNKRKRIELL